MSIKSLLALLIVAVLSGCATDGAYSVAKVAYIGGKQIVVINADLIDADTMDELKKIDRVAVTYDGVRTEIKKIETATADSKDGKTGSDTNSTVGGSTDE